MPAGCVSAAPAAAAIASAAPAASGRGEDHGFAGVLELACDREDAARPPSDEGDDACPVEFVPASQPLTLPPAGTIELTAGAEGSASEETALETAADTDPSLTVGGVAAASGTAELPSPAVTSSSAISGAPASAATDLGKGITTDGQAAAEPSEARTRSIESQHGAAVSRVANGAAPLETPANGRSGGAEGVASDDVFSPEAASPIADRTPAPSVGPGEPNAAAESADRQTGQGSQWLSRVPADSNLRPSSETPDVAGQQLSTSPVTEASAEVSAQGQIETDSTNAEPDGERARNETPRRAAARPGSVPSETGRAEATAVPAHPTGSGTDANPRGSREQLAFPELQAAVRLGARPAAYLSFAGSLVIPRTDEILALAHTGLPPGAASSLPNRVENAERLMQTMRVMVKDGVSEATIRLRPEHLGDVRIEIRVEGRSVTATVNAESSAVREWLRLNEETLRTSLSQQGLSLDRLLVQRERQERREQPKQELHRSKTRRERDPQPRFEVSA